MAALASPRYRHLALTRVSARGLWGYDQSPGRAVSGTPPVVSELGETWYGREAIRAAAAAGAEIDVLQLRGDDALADALMKLDRPGAPALSALAAAVAGLRRAKVPLKQITEILDTVPDLATASRLAAIAVGDPVVLRGLDKTRVRLGHLRGLLSVPAHQRMHWLGRIQGEKLSVARLAKELRVAAAPRESADIAHFARELSEQLGAAVQVTGSAAAGWGLQIDWDSVPALVGLLRKLSHAPGSEDESPDGTHRTLHLGPLSPAELDALVGHLLA